MELIKIINEEMDLSLPAHTSFEEVRQQLQDAISHLIETDFRKLALVLYRIDVNERKLKYLLQENVGTDAAGIIADLIIERQLQKIETRKQFGRQNGNDAISDEEKW